MSTITKHELIKLHAQLNSAGLMDYKRDIIMSVTNYRTDSSKELNRQEYSAVLLYLSNHDVMHRMRRRVFSLARKAGMIYGTSKDDLKMNTAKINTFLIFRGTVKKPINDLTKSDLTKVIRQFESIVNNNNKSNCNKELKSILEELNINVE